MNAIDRILNEVDVDYKTYATMPADLLNEYPFLARKTCHEFSLHIALTMVLYATMKYLKSTGVKDESMQQLIGNVATFSALRFRGGRELLGDLQQYMADYTANAMRNGGRLSVPYHLEDSVADTIVRSCEKICFPYIHCLVVSTFDDGYSGSSANFFRHFIRRAEDRYLIYKPLFDMYYHVLKGDVQTNEPQAGNKTSKTQGECPAPSTGCMVPIVLFLAATVLGSICGCR